MQKKTLYQMERVCLPDKENRNHYQITEVTVITERIVETIKGFSKYTAYFSQRKTAIGLLFIVSVKHVGKLRCKRL